jgi:dTDP-4-dehydrorhamnose reductase
MAKRVLVTGATGQLGAYLVRELIEQGCEVVAWGHARPATVAGVEARPVDLADAADVEGAFRDAKPDVVIHAAAMAAVADCARQPERAEAVNTRGTATLAHLCDVGGARLVFASTDLVFDGERAPYREVDPPAPLSVYGRTKAAAERAVLQVAGYTVVRVSLLFGPSLNGKPNFFDHQMVALRGGQPVRLFHDEWRTPLDFSTAAKALISVARSPCGGLLHVGGPEGMSRLEMGRRLAAYLGVETTAIEAVSRTTAGGEPRPRDTSLDSTRWRDTYHDLPWPAFEKALAETGIRPAA